MSGKVVYYDPKEGEYYDKDTDMYMSYDEFQQHDNDYGDMKDERDEVKKEADELNIGAKGDRPYKAPRQPKRGDPINPKSKGVDPKVLNMFLTNSITEKQLKELSDEDRKEYYRLIKNPHPKRDPNMPNDPGYGGGNLPPNDPIYKPIPGSGMYPPDDPIYKPIPGSGRYPVGKNPYYPKGGTVVNDPRFKKAKWSKLEPSMDPKLMQDDVAVRRDGKTLSKGEKAKLQRQGVLMKEGGTKSVIDMIANADNPEEMVMDLVDRGDAIGKFLYSELEQLATEAGTTFNNAESMPEDFVDELLANMGIEGYTFEGAPKSSPRPKPRPMRVPRPKPRPTTRIGGMPGGSTRGIDPKDNYSPEDLKRLLMQSAMSEMEEAEEEGMIVYVGDQKFEYSDYTLEDAMRIVDEYADEMDGEPYEVYNADGKLVASGTMRSGAFHEPGIEEGVLMKEGEEKPYICVHAKKGKHECRAETSYAAAKKAAEHWGLKSTSGIDAHLAIDEGDGRKKGIHPKGHPMRKKQQAAIHAGESKRKVSMNQVCEAVKQTDPTYAVAMYVRTTLDPSYKTWDQVFEQVKHIVSCINEGETVNVNTVMQLLSRQNLQEKADKEMMRKENIDSLRKIVKENTAMPIKFSDGSIKVDATTANVFLEVFNKQKQQKQNQIVEKIQTKSGFLSMLEMMYKKIG
jgi:ribosome-binding factor A